MGVQVGGITSQWRIVTQESCVIGFGNRQVTFQMELEA